MEKLAIAVLIYSLLALVAWLGGDSPTSNAPLKILLQGIGTALAIYLICLIFKSRKTP